MFIIANKYTNKCTTWKEYAARIWHSYGTAHHDWSWFCPHSCHLRNFILLFVQSLDHGDVDPTIGLAPEPLWTIDFAIEVKKNMFGWFRGHHICRSPTYFRQPDIFAGLFSSVGRSSTHSPIGGVELGVQEFLVTAAVKHGKTPVVLGNKEPFHLESKPDVVYNSSTSKYRMIPAVDSHSFYSDMTVGIR